MDSLTGLRRLFIPRTSKLARVWSNRILARVAVHFEGEIINVSAWDDRDKEGGRYKDYFTNASHYYLSNYGGDMGACEETDFELDLEADLPRELTQRFEVVFNHTTVEHIFNVFKAFENLCAMSKDVVLVVVPFVQREHYMASFRDYWRFTRFSLERLFENNGLETVYIATTPYRNSAIYHICVASRHPAKWRPRFAGLEQPENVGEGITTDPVLARAASLWRRLVGRGRGRMRG